MTTKSHWVSQQIPRLLWKPNVHYRVHKSLSLVPILRQMHTINNFPPRFPKIHSILSYTLRLGLRVVSSLQDSQSNYCMHFSSLPCVLIPHPSHIPWFHNPKNIWWSVQIMKLFIMQASPAFRHFLYLRFKYSPQHPLETLRNIYF